METAHAEIVSGKDIPGLAPMPQGGSPTQSLDRAMDLLDVVVGHALAGASLGTLAAIAGLSKPTAHRLLSGLRNSGLIDYDPALRLFFPAFKLYSMGQAAAVRFGVIEAAEASLERLAEETGDTVLLAARSGDFSVCVARRNGPFPIKPMALQVGDVHPLGLGSSGLVLLAALRDDEVERNLARHQEAFRRWPQLDDDTLRALVASTRADRHAFHEGLLHPDMSDLAVGIRGPNGVVDAALSVAAIHTRLQPARRVAVLELLQEEVAAIEAMVMEGAGGRRGL